MPSDNLRGYVRPAEEIPLDESPPEPNEKTDIHGRTIAQLEREIWQQKRVLAIAESYSGMEGYARRLAEMRRNLDVDERYLIELKNRPDTWPKDGGEALWFSLEGRR